jgi:hypothetical protein
MPDCVRFVYQWFFAGHRLRLICGSGNVVYIAREEQNERRTRVYVPGNDKLRIMNGD